MSVGEAAIEKQDCCCFCWLMRSRIESQPLCLTCASKTAIKRSVTFTSACESICPASKKVQSSAWGWTKHASNREKETFMRRQLWLLEIIALGDGSHRKYLPRSILWLFCMDTICQHNIFDHVLDTGHGDRQEFRPKIGGGSLERNPIWTKRGIFAWHISKKGCDSTFQISTFLCHWSCSHSCSPDRFQVQVAMFGTFVPGYFAKWGKQLWNKQWPHKNLQLTLPTVTTFWNKHFDLAPWDATLSALSLVSPALNAAKKLTAFAIACLFWGTWFVCAFPVFWKPLQWFVHLPNGCNQKWCFFICWHFLWPFCCMCMTINQQNELSESSELSMNALVVSFCMHQCTRMILIVNLFVLFDCWVFAVVGNGRSHWCCCADIRGNALRQNWELPLHHSLFNPIREANPSRLACFGSSPVQGQPAGICQFLDLFSPSQI